MNKNKFTKFFMEILREFNDFGAVLDEYFSKDENKSNDLYSDYLNFKQHIIDIKSNYNV